MPPSHHKVGTLRSRVAACHATHGGCSSRCTELETALDEFGDEDYDLNLPVLNDRLKDKFDNPGNYAGEEVDQALSDLQYILKTAKREKDIVSTVFIIPKPWDPVNYNTHINKAVIQAKRINAAQYIIVNPVEMRGRFGVLNAHQCIEVGGDNGPARMLTREEYITLYDSLT